MEDLAPQAKEGFRELRIVDTRETALAGLIVALVVFCGSLLWLGIGYVVTHGLPWWGWAYLAFMLTVEVLLFTKWRP